MADDAPSPEDFLDQAEIDRLLAQEVTATAPRQVLIRADGTHAGSGSLKIEPYDFRNPAFLSEVELRRGAAFVVTRGEELLVRSRPEKGLLGGMTEVPGSDWHADQDDKAALKQAPELKGVTRWHRKAGIVTHVFTHFPLELVVYTATALARAPAPAGMRWVPVSTLQDEALPNVMRKVIAHGLDL